MTTKNPKISILNQILENTLSTFGDHGVKTKIEYQDLTSDWHYRLEEFFDFIVLPGAINLNKYSAEVEKLHYYNYQIWHHEDYCRGDDDSIIPKHKKEIDKFNQKRNNQIERLDEFLISQFQNQQQEEWYGPSLGSIIHSETPGSIIDRLSILDLKIYHVKELLDANKIAGSNGEKYQALMDRWNLLKEQFKHLAICFESLLKNMMERKLYVHTFKQLKMYNDPSTNPKHRDRNVQPD